MLQDNRLSVGERAGRFHASLAYTIKDQAEVMREKYGVDKVGLVGGVFQNRILTEQTVNLLQENDFNVYLPNQIPGNDAGLSFGQIIEASAKSGYFI